MAAATEVVVDLPWRESLAARASMLYTPISRAGEYSTRTDTTSGFLLMKEEQEERDG